MYSLDDKKIIKNHYYYLFLEFLFEFSTPALVCVIGSILKSPGFSSVFWSILILLLFEWSSLVFFYQVLQVLYQSFGDCTKSTNYNWYHRHFQVPQFFQFSSKVEVLISLFVYFELSLLLLSLLLLLTHWEFFTPVSSDGLSLEPEWQQVTSSLQDSSQYPGRSQKCCSLDSLH